LEELSAFAICDDHKKQDRVWNELPAFNCNRTSGCGLAQSVSGAPIEAPQLSHGRSKVCSEPMRQKPFNGREGAAGAFGLGLERMGGSLLARGGHSIAIVGVRRGARALSSRFSDLRSAPGVQPPPLRREFGPRVGSGHFSRPRSRRRGRAPWRTGPRQTRPGLDCRCGPVQLWLGGSLGSSGWGLCIPLPHPRPTSRQGFNLGTIVYDSSGRAAMSKKIGDVHPTHGYGDGINVVDVVRFSKARG
jgi:hypothetical protein